MTITIPYTMNKRESHSFKELCVKYTIGDGARPS